MVGTHPAPGVNRARAARVQRDELPPLQRGILDILRTGPNQAHGHFRTFRIEVATDAHERLSLLVENTFNEKPHFQCLPDAFQRCARKPLCPKLSGAPLPMISSGRNMGGNRRTQMQVQHVQAACAAAVQLRVEEWAIPGDRFGPLAIRELRPRKGWYEVVPDLARI